MARLRELLEGPRGVALGLCATVAVALVIALQGVTVAWWAHADPDGAYTGSALNLLRGEDTQYLDHPGLPTQVGLAVAFGGDYLVQRLRGSDDSLDEYVDARLLDLDSARPVYRTWAVLQYVGGAVLVYLVLTWFLRHWTWGLAGALLYLVAPGLAEIATLLRPDTALTALCLAVAVFTAAGVESRSAASYLAAAVLLGLAMTVKLTAVGLVPVLAVAVLVRPPLPGWGAELRGRGAAFVRRRPVPLAIGAAAWLALAVWGNRGRFPFVETDEQRDMLLTIASVVGGHTAFALAAARWRLSGATRVFVPFYGATMVAFLAGFALPATLALDAGAQMPVSIFDTLRGKGVNEGIDAFSEVAWRNFQEHEQRAIVVVGAVALMAAAVGVARRQWWPLLLAAGAAVLATMAAARLGYDYYFAPAFAVAIPGALWALRRGRRAVPLLGWVVVGFAFLPLLAHLPQWYADPRNDAAQQLADGLLAPGEVALAPPPYELPIEDTWWDYLVDGFADPVPAYPHRFYVGMNVEEPLARGLRPRYAVAPVDQLPPGTEPLEWSFGGETYTARRLEQTWYGGAYGVAELVDVPAAAS